MSHSRKLYRNVAQFLAKSSPEPVAKRTKPGTPYRRQKLAEVEWRGGHVYHLLHHATKGFRWERQPLPGSMAGVVS